MKICVGIVLSLLSVGVIAAPTAEQVMNDMYASFYANAGEEYSGVLCTGGKMYHFTASRSAMQLTVEVSPSKRMRPSQGVRITLGDQIRVETHGFGRQFAPAQGSAYTKDLFRYKAITPMGLSLLVAKRSFTYVYGANEDTIKAVPRDNVPADYDTYVFHLGDNAQFGHVIKEVEFVKDGEMAQTATFTDIRSVKIGGREYWRPFTITAVGNTGKTVLKRGGDSCDE